MYEQNVYVGPRIILVETLWLLSFSIPIVFFKCPNLHVFDSSIE